MTPARGTAVLSPDIEFASRILGIKFDPSCGDDVCPRHKVVSLRAQVPGSNPMSGDSWHYEKGRLFLR